MEHPPDNFTLQNGSWHTPKRDWRPPICSLAEPKIKFALLRGGGGCRLGAERKIVQKRLFFGGGKRHNNKNLKVQILLSRNLVVVAQAPSLCVELHRNIPSPLSYLEADFVSALRTRKGRPAERGVLWVSSRHTIGPIIITLHHVIFRN